MSRIDLTCPRCEGDAELNGSGGITCFFCGYDGPGRFAGTTRCWTCGADYPAQGDRHDAYMVHTGAQRHKDAVAKAVGRV